MLIDFIKSVNCYFLHCSIKSKSIIIDLFLIVHLTKSKSEFIIQN